MRNERREQYNDPFVSFQHNQQRCRQQSFGSSLTEQLLMSHLLNSNLNSNTLDNVIIINGSVYPIFKIGNAEFIKINGKDIILMSSGPHKFIELNESVIKVK